MEAIKRIIREYEDLPFEGIPRGFDAELYQLQSALTIIGPRRSGKTTYLREIIQSLGLSHFLFLNFEDERVIHLPEIDPFIEAYYEMYHEKPHIFMDEVQNTENWHLKVRRLIDQGYKVFVTGSNANLLSKEIATHLAGRTFTKTILPFSFKELLRLNGISVDSDTLYGKERFAVKRLFRDYLIYGGFPEVAKTRLKKDLLHQYSDIVFYKDLMARYRIRQETILKLLINKLHENIGNVYKVSRIRNKIIQHVNVGRQTIFDYLRFLEETYFVFHVQSSRRSVMVRQTERKSYFVDTGFITLLSLEEDLGRLLENAIFLELLKRGETVYYHREKYECDFVTETENRITHAIQSTWLLSDTNRDREINGLLEAMNRFNLDSGLILTEAQEETLEINGKMVQIKPAWKWMIE
ncbi:MAG: ATP-binding protein [bacterium]